MSEAATLARNVVSRYLAIAAEAGIGLVMLPFNVAHLGQAGYGLWMLTASVTAYFSVLDLGYAGSVVRFVAHYRARRDTRALNEILSTLGLVFLVLGLVAYGIGALVALFLGHLFTLTPAQLATGRIVLFILSANVSAGIAFTVFGGVVNGFQRYDLNNLVGTASSLATAAVNVLVLWLGYGLVTLVAATTAVKLLTYLAYRANAYRVFPGLVLSRHLVRGDRLRELTRFSLYISLSDWAAKLNYSIDALVIGAFLGPASVAVWSVAQRIADAAVRLTNQLSDVLFPNIVDHATASRTGRLGEILIEATRLSLAAAIPIGVSVGVLAEPLILRWVGPAFRDSVLVLQLLMVTVVLRVGNGTGFALLKGSGEHRLAAVTNAAAAIANVTLSIALVRPFGYAGVAVGTLVPVSLAALMVVFPMACRRVGIPIRSAFARAVLPTLWPGVVVGLALIPAREIAAESWMSLVGLLVAGTLAYVVMFIFVSLGPEDRRRYTARVAALWWRSRLQPVSEGA